MFRVTAALVVMVLAGIPAASLACELLCGADAAASSHASAGCHAEADSGSGLRLTAVRAACHQDGAGALLTEARQAGAASVAGSTVPNASKVATIAPPTDRTYPTWWPVFEAPPPCGPARAAILRI